MAEVTGCGANVLGWAFDTSSASRIDRGSNTPARGAVAVGVISGTGAEATEPLIVPEASGKESPLFGGFVRIRGESFQVEIDDDVIYIRHDRWSLLGSGATVLDAELDLLSEVQELWDVFSEIPVSSMNPEAVEMRNFLLRAI